MINAGAMRENVIIEHKSATLGTLGQVRWETYLTTRGSLENLAGRELVAPAIEGSSSTHKFTVRYRMGIKASMRVRTQREPTRVFEIDYALPDPMLRKVELLCTEIMTA